MSTYGYRPSPWDERGVIEPIHDVTPNTDLVVTVPVAKNHLSYPVEDTAFDLELTGFLWAAQRTIEKWLDMHLLTTVVREDRPELTHRHTLSKRPYQSFDKIEYVRASDGEIVEVDETDYHVLKASQFRADVYLQKSGNWPRPADRADAFRLHYTVGFEDADSVPPDIKMAILMTVARLDQQRGDCGGDDVKFAAQSDQPAQVIPAGARALLDPYRLVELYVV